MSRDKKYRKIEPRLVSDYISRYMKDYTCFERVRVGPYYGGQLEPGLSSSERNMMEVWRYYADAICIGEDDLVLIEAALRFRSDHVGKLLGYMFLLPVTPELSPFAGKELKPLALASQFDALAKYLCDWLEFKTVRFCPPYAEKYLDSLAPRKQRSSLPLLPSHSRKGANPVEEYRV